MKSFTLLALASPALGHCMAPSPPLTPSPATGFPID
jgi:hypothetical protein